MGRRNNDKTVPPTDAKKTLVVYLPRDLHFSFKRYCEEQDRGMSDVIRESIQEKVTQGSADGMAKEV